jgi:hypothetical protein
MEGLPDFLVMGVPIVVLVPAIVQKLKEAGLPTRYATFAAMLVALALIVLVRLARHEATVDDAAAYLLAAIVYGLASSGLYTQGKAVIAGRAPAP